MCTRGGSSARPAWLLIKQRDEFASAEDIVATEPRSVVSNRLMAEIAWQEGGDVEKAASADPPAAVRRLLANSKAARPERRKPPRIATPIAAGRTPCHSGARAPPASPEPKHTGLCIVVMCRCS